MKRRTTLLPVMLIGILVLLLIAVLTTRDGTAEQLGQGKSLVNKVPTEPPTIPVPVPSAVPSSVIPECEALPFTDVSRSDWFYAGVDYLFCERIISGYNTNPPCVTGTPCFNPDGAMSRGQAAKVIWKMIIPSEPVTDGFTDVLPGSPFYEPIGGLKSAGVATGYPDNTFRPGEPVSRGQFIKMASAAIFVHLAPWWQITLPAVSTFEDVQPGNPFYDHIETAAAHGVVYGYPCGGPGEPCGTGNKPYFRPGAPVNRAQASIIAVRLEMWAAPH